MGIYYEHEPRPREPGGCSQVLILTWAAFSILFWPMLALGLLLAVLASALILLAIHPALVLIPLAVAAVGVWLFAKWERRHVRSPGPPGPPPDL